MVKRDKVIPGAVIQVCKEVPGTAGPEFMGKFALNERLDVVSAPYYRGVLHLVDVSRRKTGEKIHVLYAFVTNYCRPESTRKIRSRKPALTVPAPPPVMSMPPPEELPTLVPDGEEIPPVDDES